MELKVNTLYYSEELATFIFIYKIEGLEVHFTSTDFLRDCFTSLIRYKAYRLFVESFNPIELTDENRMEYGNYDNNIDCFRANNSVGSTVRLHKYGMAYSDIGGDFLDCFKEKYQHWHDKYDNTSWVR